MDAALRFAPAGREVGRTAKPSLIGNAKCANESGVTRRIRRRILDKASGTLFALSGNLSACNQCQRCDHGQAHESDARHSETLSSIAIIRSTAWVKEQFDRLLTPELVANVKRVADSSDSRPSRRGVERGQAQRLLALLRPSASSLPCPCQPANRRRHDLVRFSEPANRV